MQFIKNGPDIPESLVQAHEDGRVVFFCGAGISYPAGLPDFAGLVQKIYEKLGVSADPIQQAAIEANQFDIAIGLLERDCVGGRERVRRALAEILTPDGEAQNATATHEALLTLGKCRNGHTRIITTNFDRLFEKVIEDKGLSIKRFQAPHLPVPKNRWDGLVYLHGLLGAEPTKGELDQLVVSSGDFGLAYLTERWAARFVSELFRNYTVCFIGYSINDPVLRYMVDALAADSLLGETPSEMFAFGSFSNDNEEERANGWKAKNVTPILYREDDCHAYLHKTLHAWAEAYRDGVLGKERIVVECATVRPLPSTRQDDFVGRMLWALSDPSGLPAKRFAEHDPVPSLDWLGPLSEDRYGYADLERFGFPPKTPKDDTLTFSLTCRPSPYPLAPSMCISDNGARRSGWDEVMRHLASWLIRHLDDPNLLLWLVERGGQLHDELATRIKRRLVKLSKLECDGKTEELAQIRANAPNAIPGRRMRILWRLLLTGRVKSRSSNLNLGEWYDLFKQDGLTATLRLKLREILTPRVLLHKRSPQFAEDSENRQPKCIKDLVEWEVVLSADDVDASLPDLSRDDRWKTVLPDLLFDVSALLRDALDLMRELGGAQDKSDLSYMYQPSISEHRQNERFHEWTVLIDLTRDAWLATVEQSPALAALVAQSWWHTPYPLFRRLAFFAAAQRDVIPQRQALDWLLADNRWWLWSEETQREVMRLLVALAPQLDEAMQRELEQAVLAGPPREMSTEYAESESWSGIVERKTWLRLAKMAEAGPTLTADGNQRLQELSDKYPGWKLEEDQRDEFPYWKESGWVKDRVPWRDFVSIPCDWRGLLNYLKEHPELPESKQDDWRERCRTNFRAAAYALCYLSKQDKWPNDRWREALRVWSEENLRSRSWRYMAKVLVNAPDDMLQALARDVSLWLRAIAETFKDHEKIFFKLACRILGLDYRDDAVDTDDPVTRAINHPVGHVTEALLSWWYRRPLADGQGLPKKIKFTFTKLCDRKIDKFRHGRVLLAAHVITLFRVDGEWATRHLLPLFDWQHSKAEARAVWQGFLWSPRLDHPLMEKLKPAFLDTARNYAALGKFERQYASLLTFAALDPRDIFTTPELRGAISALGQDGLCYAAQALVQALEGAGEQREDYWKHRIQPFWKEIWPKSRNLVTPRIVKPLARLAIAAREEFPAALTEVKDWLQPIEDPDIVVNLLDRSGLCDRHPTEALHLLHAVISDPQWVPKKS